MTQIQTWTFSTRSPVCHTVGDPARARVALAEAVNARSTREIVAWLPDYTVLHVNRVSPDAPWRIVKGSLAMLE
jgi:hypothetical protein